MVMLGKEVRMSWLVNPESKKMTVITADHAISRGIAPMKGLQPIQETIEEIVMGRPDAMTMTKGIAEHCIWPFAGKAALSTKVSNYSPVSSTRGTIFESVNEAARVGADAVFIGTMTLGNFQGEQSAAISRFFEECMAKGMPFIGYVYPKGESVPADKQTSWESIAYCMGSACELDMDIVKTTHTGDPDSIARVVSCVPSSFRIVIQGDDKYRILDDYLTMTREAMDCGVGGVTMGRFVWEYEDVTAPVIALWYMTHKRYTVKQAKELLAQLEHDKNYEDFQDRGGRMKIMVLDGYTENPGDLSWGGLEALGTLTVYDRTPGDKVIERIADTQAVYANKTPITGETIEKCTNVKFIGVLATGYNVIDIKAARSANVVVSSIPSYGTDVVAQYAMVLLLELCHHIEEYSDCVRAGGWNRSKDWCFWKHPLVELAGKTSGVIGFERIGQRTAKMAEALGTKMVAYDERPVKELEGENFRYAFLDELLSMSDVISLHCPLFPLTEGIINRDTIAKMKDGVKVINTSKDPLIVEQGLRQALNSGKVSGAAVDVASEESIREDNPPLGAENSIIIPHIVWVPRESRQRLMDIAVSNLKVFMEENLINVVS